jgi:hypothetical protein
MGDVGVAPGAEKVVAAATPFCDASSAVVFVVSCCVFEEAVVAYNPTQRPHKRQVTPHPITLDHMAPLQLACPHGP